MALTDHDEREMKRKCERQLKGDVASPLEKLRLYCLSRGVSGIKSVAVYFRQVDNNRDKKLDLEEFKDCFQQANIKADAATIQEAFGSVDLDGNGKINFDEFLIALRGPIPQQRLKLIDLAFNKMDSDGSGIIDLKDVKGKYNGRYHPKYVNGEWSEDEVLEHWLKQFGASSDAQPQITKDDFLNYYVGVSSSIDDNAYFDLMMRRAWKL